MTTADVLIDCRGKRCPMPVIELARHIRDVPVGGLLGIVADDPVAVLDIPVWCHMRDQDYAGTELDHDGVSIYLVRRRT